MMTLSPLLHFLLASRPYDDFSDRLGIPTLSPVVIASVSRFSLLRNRLARRWQRHRHSTLSPVRLRWRVIACMVFPPAFMHIIYLWEEGGGEKRQS